MHKTETQATRLMAQRLGPTRLRSKMASSSSTSKYAGYNFLTRIQNLETVDFGIMKYIVHTSRRMSKTIIGDIGDLLSLICLLTFFNSELGEKS